MMLTTRNKKLSYEALESLCKDLQEQVSQNLKTKQNLKARQLELEWELSKTQSIQQFSEAAMRVENFKQLNTFTVKSFVDIFHEPNSILFQFSTQKQRLYTLAKNGFDTIKVPKSFHFLPLLLPKRTAVLIKEYPKLQEFFAFLQLRESILCPFYNVEGQFSGLILSGHTAQEALFTEPIQDRICHTYTVMTHNYGVLSGNFLQLDTLKHKIQHHKTHILNIKRNQKTLLEDQDELNTTIQEQIDDLFRLNNLLESQIIQVKDSEYQLSVSQQQRKRLHKELEELAYIASHDLKAPIRTIASFVQLLKKRSGEQLDKTSNDYMEFILAGIKRFDNVINDLIQYTKISQTEGEVTEVNLQNILQNAILFHNEKIELLAASINSQTLPTLKADKTLIELLFQHLLDNALKFSNNDTPKVQINVEQKDHHYHFVISDNGIGIDERFYHKVFELFQQLNTETPNDGTGIGLSVCKKIVERHQGKIWIDAELNHGTEVHFTLPTDLKELH